MTESSGAPRFATVICCMDGRFVTRTSDQVASRFGARHVDVITAPGPVRFFESPGESLEILMKAVDISTSAHDSRQIAVVAHADCAGNPVDAPTQREQLETAHAYLAGSYPDHEVMALFFDPDAGFQRVR